MSLRDRLGPKKINQEEAERRDARQKLLEIERAKHRPATGSGIRISDLNGAAVSRSTIYRWIKSGKIATKREKSAAGGRTLIWIVSLKNIPMKAMKATDQDLH